MNLPPGLRIEGSTILHELRVGWHDFWSRTWLWAIVLQFAIVLAVEFGSFNVLGPAVAKRDLGGPGAWGGVLAAQSFGLVLTGTVMLKWQPRRILLTATLGVFPLVLPLFALAGPAPLAVVIASAFLAGVGIEVFGVLWDTAMQQEIPGERLSRLSAYDALGSFILMPVGLAAMGPVASVIGTRTAFLGSAAVIVIATALVLLSRDVRTLERRS